MAESGVDISGQYSKLLSELPITDFDLVVAVCDQITESCPHFQGSDKIIRKSFPDPPQMAPKNATEEKKLVHFRLVRDHIKEFVNGILEKW